MTDSTIGSLIAGLKVLSRGVAELDDEIVALRDRIIALEERLTPAEEINPKELLKRIQRLEARRS